jgi:hypothetical protein
VSDALTDDDGVLNGTSWPYVFDTWTVDLDDMATVRRTMETSEFGTTSYASGASSIFEIREFRVESSPTPIDVRSSSRQSGARGDYTLRIDLPPLCSPGAVIRLGETIDGEISPSDCFRNPSPVTSTHITPLADSFALSLEEETQVEVLLETQSSFYASIINEQGEDLLLISLRLAPDGNQRAVLPAGRYALWVGTQGPHIANWVSLGSYRFSIREIP